MDIKVEPMDEDTCFNNNNNTTISNNNKKSDVLTRTPHVFSIERLLQTKCSEARPGQARSPTQPAQDSVAHLQRLARLADAIGAERRDAGRRASLSPLTVVVHADSSQRRSSNEDDEQPGDSSTYDDDDEDDPDCVHSDLGDGGGESSAAERLRCLPGNSSPSEAKQRSYTEVHCGEVSTSSHKGE